MGLADITRDAVLQAIAECDREGRDAFRKTYGFHHSRDYVLVHEGVLYDTKPIAGVAHKYAAGRPLKASEFSGGAKHAAGRLAKLGFEVTLAPGDPAARLAEQIERLRVQSTEDGPARHQPIVLLWAFGRARRRLPRLVRWSHARAELRELMEKYGQPSSRPRPDYPFLALHRTPLWEVTGHGFEEVPVAHGDAVGLRWLDEHDPLCGLTGWVHEAVAGSAQVRDRAVTAVLARFFAGADTGALLRDVGLEEGPAGDGGSDRSREEYRRLVEKVEEGERAGRDRRTVKRSAGERPVRSPEARAAVLERCGGRCENPRCAGQPEDVNEKGEPILEVDHVDDRAKWGRDHPAAMVALCPNCHAVKTHGRTKEELREVLRAEARERHGAWLPLEPGLWLSTEAV
ncbi:HNH endonuclease signature motif containing protein [Actinomadura parmotrematis]|uniref:HNH endonuclease n=1 Tax=Actinomadura parmotrematis TaxID=2864039 RepID=A0ABS7FYK1_9ACTN|nr:HNH endonuclease signature motif containing protein [Actinomadura parmotrematis]MBW8485518.1 HNH endonuclease [Actinomadura parmotrematis]